MASALLMALWCATASSTIAARYSDYSGANMPQYGGPEYDAREPRRDHGEYRDLAPDVHDYKYEDRQADAFSDGNAERFPVQSKKKDFDDTESWERPDRITKKTKTSHAHEHFNNFDPEDDFPKHRINRLVTKYRRVKDRIKESNDDAQGYSISRYRHHGDNQGNEERSVMNDYRNDNRKIDDKSNYRERKVRRKPRDKFDRAQRISHDNIDPAISIGNNKDGLDIGMSSDRDRGYFNRDDSGASDRDDFRPGLSDKNEMEKADSDLDRWMLMRGGLGKAPEPDAPSDLEQERGLRMRPELPLRMSPLNNIRNEVDFPRPTKSARNKGLKAESDEEYNNDYYDMKRVMNVKNKLPSLLHRTTVRKETTPDPFPDLADKPTFSEASQSLKLLPHRRLHGAGPATRTPLSAALATEPMNVIPISTSTITTEPTTATSPVKPNTGKVVRNDTVLSLAEKSRLSIMKKALRKENSEGGSTTKKPPVLLQVTRKLPTMVMVEPATSEALMRGRDVYADSPARLANVKRLMRHKLVAGAKNIQDLTDNWDDMVCDYIDMSLLEKLNIANKISSPKILFLSVILMLR